MISGYYLSQLPDAVVQDPIASSENLYLLTSILIYRQKYRPTSEQQIQLFILGTQKVLQWRMEDFLRVLQEVEVLLGTHEDVLEKVCLLLPTQKAATA